MNLKQLPTFKPVTYSNRSGTVALMKRDSDGQYLQLSDVQDNINPDIYIGTWSNEMSGQLSRFIAWYQTMMDDPQFEKNNSYERTHGEWLALFQLFLAQQQKEELR